MSSEVTLRPTVGRLAAVPRNVTRIKVGQLGVCRMRRPGNSHSTE
jgi:hypothetical protein